MKQSLSYLNYVTGESILNLKTLHCQMAIESECELRNSQKICLDAHTMMGKNFKCKRINKKILVVHNYSSYTHFS